VDPPATAFDATAESYDGVFRTQRHVPRMATVRPEVRDGGQRLVLHAPGVAALPVDVDLDGARRDVELFGSPYTGIDQGEAAAGWLSEVLGLPSRLVRVPPDHDRVTGGETPGTAGYADSNAVLLAGRASLDALNSRVTGRDGAPVPMPRFRPNVVVDGWHEPHVEDRARRIEVGDAELGFAKVAIRCAVTTVDQETGERVGPEPLRTLATYRRMDEGGVAFGAKFSVVRPGTLTVGDELRVRRWAERGPAITGAGGT
jgi:uncharacterized protein YcbX